MAERRPVYFTDNEKPVYLPGGNFSDPKTTDEYLGVARDLLRSGESEKVPMKIYGQEVDGFLFEYKGENVIITDGFWSVIEKVDGKNKITKLMPFTYFYRK